MITQLKTRFTSFSYNALITLSVPFLFFHIYLKGRHNSDYRLKILNRVGFGFNQIPRNALWFHTVSDGEFLASKNLIKKFIDSDSSRPILITTTTPTGKSRVAETFAAELNKQVFHAYLPFDQFHITKRFIKKVQPKAGFFVETEIWPNLVKNLNKAKIPSALINARLSERSCKGYAKFGHFASETLNRYNLIIAQDNNSAQRFKQLTKSIKHPAVSIQTIGNLKFDIKPPENSRHQIKTLQSKLGNSTYWIAASTHEGEDEIMINSHLKLIRTKLNLKLIIAPRHPERSTNIAKICENNNLRAVLFSNINQVVKSDFDIVILDSIGLLLSLFSNCSIAVIGGSFVKHGGHNPLEACLFSKPVITGPHYFNFQSLMDELIKANGLVHSSETKLSMNISKLIDNPEPIASNGHKYLSKNRGTTDKSYDLLIQLIESKNK